MSSTSQVFTVGQVLTAAETNQFPQGIIALNRATADAGPTSGTTELTVITAAAVTINPTNRRLKISFHARFISGSVTNDGFTLRIKEGATVLQEAFFFVALASTGLSMASDFSAIVDSPTAASHTYSVTIQRFAGTGTATVSGTATAPITITVEDAGQV